MDGRSAHAMWLERHGTQDEADVHVGHAAGTQADVKKKVGFQLRENGGPGEAAPMSSCFHGPTTVGLCAHLCG